MARADAVTQLLRALEFGGDVLRERLAFGALRPVFARGRGAFGVIGIVMGRIDQKALLTRSIIALSRPGPYGFREPLQIFRSPDCLTDGQDNKVQSVHNVGPDFILQSI